MVHRNQVIEVKIDDFAFGGQGLARMKSEEGDFILFVENTFPGQFVRARVDKKRKRHAECKLLEVLERSPLEKALPYQEISGAPYLFVPIEIQQEYKKKSTLDVYRKIGRIPDPGALFDQFISSPEVFFYRNKMEYSFSSIEHVPETGEEIDDAFALGFKRRGTWWKVENLNKPSGLFDEQWETILPEFRDLLKSFGLSAWHPPRKEGFFRHIVVRKSFDQDQLLLHIVTSSVGIKKFDTKKVVEFLKEKLGNRLAGIWHTINDNVADRAKIENGTSTLLFGESVVVEKMLGLSFEISMESFFQTNPKSAERLYTKAIDYVCDHAKDGGVIMDLFCGTGTIGQLVAQRVNAGEIIGVDIVEEAIEDAKRNAKRNKLEHLHFFAADVGKFLSLHPEYLNRIDTIVLDPPRAGIAPKTLQKVMALGASHLVYISCNPSTQARDTETLEQGGYKLTKLSLVDQFPHTSHIEAIAVYEKLNR
ncbi:23S rRNA (uracil(1939)-C(5))-methyltransferase RlmD [Fluviicola chungangensis]|uniref:23S rRNA (Uracil(1939)-C(5))-methyltransferase RlmD n=1 Tax=Fluviicola chungangensis TaxID=2597671 RepID=A0A556MXZ6_9FLAO|nr:23S rRNA (uracil(1939)-C(5))-methyltransferase RlmD [Fluviicola chungangensis]TSJ44794.1 23S rRNA (uracil(1939)-C(5))-methyltransferase RlmD [Fluviicola chungangensis]